jgi:hypothetical protein
MHHVSGDWRAAASRRQVGTRRLPNLRRDVLGSHDQSAGTPGGQADDFLLSQGLRLSCRMVALLSFGGGKATLNY